MSTNFLSHICVCFIYVQWDRLNTLSTILQNHRATTCRATSRRLLTKLPLFYHKGESSSLSQNVSAYWSNYVASHPRRT